MANVLKKYLPQVKSDYFILLLNDFVVLSKVS